MNVSEEPDSGHMTWNKDGDSGLQQNGRERVRLPWKSRWKMVMDYTWLAELENIHKPLKNFKLNLSYLFILFNVGIPSA